MDEKHASDNIEEGLLEYEKRKLNREKLLRSYSTQTFLDESANEIGETRRLPTFYKRLSCVMINIFSTLFFLCLMMYVFSPSSSINISWDKTILDIETSSVTRSVKVNIKNNNFYGNKLQNLYIEEYVKTCNDPKDSHCDWQLVEEYSQEKKYFKLDGYENIDIDIDSVHIGIDIIEALDISEACLYDTLTIKFVASWKFGGAINYSNDSFEKVYCEIEEPYELSLSNYEEDFRHSERLDYIDIDTELLENDRIEQIKYNLRHADYISKKIPPQKPDPHKLYAEDPHNYKSPFKDAGIIIKDRQRTKRKLRGNKWS